MRYLGNALGLNQEQSETSEEELPEEKVIPSLPSSLNDLGERISGSERRRRTLERSLEQMEKMMLIEQKEQDQFSKKVTHL